MINNYIVYKTTNNINGKYYIGVHKVKGNNRYLGSGVALKRAIKKYSHYDSSGRENFIRETLFSFPTQQEAYNKEKELVSLDLINDPMCYNIITGGIGVGEGELHPMYGKTHSPEARKKMSDSKKGELNFRYGIPLTQEHKDKLSKSLRGKFPSQETRDKLSKMRKGKNNPMYGKRGILSPIYGRKAPQEEVDKMSGKNNPMYGKTHSPEARKKMSDANKGKTITQEARNNMSKAQTGRKHSPETIKKMSDIKKGKKKSPEAKSNMSKAQIKLHGNICMIRGIMFNSYKQASDNFNVDPTTIKNWTKNPNKPDCYSISSEQAKYPLIHIQ